MLARALTVTALVVAALATGSIAQAAEHVTPLRDVRRGLRCTARTVVQGTAISSYDVEVLDVLRDVQGGGPRILVRVSGEAVAGSGIASGFSGSPTYCPDASGRIGNAGAVSATVGQYGNDVGLVTPIEQMLGLPVRPPSGARPAPRAVRAGARPVGAPLMLSGLSPALGRLVQRTAARTGRAIVAAPVGPLGSFPPQPLVPGASMGVAYATGALSAAAVGTVTYRDGARLYGFGHLFDGAGRRSLPLTDAYVFGVIDNPLDTPEATSYKLAAPGRALGTISNDALPAVVGSVGPGPRTVPVTVTVRDRDRGRTLRQRTEIADEVDVGDPAGPGTLGTFGSLALAQAITSAFDGAPARESARMCLRLRVREIGGPLRVCNRYVINAPAQGGVPPLALAAGLDLTLALTPIETASFAALHVTDVRVDVAFERGLRLATIRRIRGPRVLRRGAPATIELRVREFQGRMRTVPLRLRVPRDAPLGEQRLRIAGTALDDPGEGGDELTIVLGLGGFGGNVGGTGPQTPAAVARAVARRARYDGLHARLGSARWRAGADPTLRIDGRGALDVRVERGAAAR